MPSSRAWRWRRDEGDAARPRFAPVKRQDLAEAPAPKCRDTFGLSPSTYTLTQLRYDLRKLKAHGLLERIGRAYCYNSPPGRRGNGMAAGTRQPRQPRRRWKPVGRHARMWANA